MSETIIPSKQTAATFKALQTIAKPINDKSIMKHGRFNGRVFASNGYMIATDSYVAAKVYSEDVEALHLEDCYEVTPYIVNNELQLHFEPCDVDAVTTICNAMQTLIDKPSKVNSAKINPRLMKKTIDLFIKLGLTADVNMREAGLYMRALDRCANTDCEAVIMRQK